MVSLNNFTIEKLAKPTQIPNNLHHLETFGDLANVIIHTMFIFSWPLLLLAGQHKFVFEKTGSNQNYLTLHLGTSCEYG